MGTALLTENLFPVETAIPKKSHFNSFIDQKEYLIHGKLQIWQGDQQLVTSPVFLNENGFLKPKMLGKYPLMTRETAKEVLNSTLKAFDNGAGRWCVMTFKERIEHVLNFTERLKEKKDEIVLLLMWEIGKSYEESVKEFDRTIQNILDTVEALKKIIKESSDLYSEGNVHAKIKRTPLGIALCMGPFNFPLNESFATLIPALLMGNYVIFKPPKHGILLYNPILKLFRDSFPEGVVNTIYGREEEVVRPIMESGKVDLFAFIGTSQAANLIQSYHPKPNRLKTVFGLEAKNPGIVLPDADIESTTSECLKGALSYNGQRCTALKILFVHSDIIDQFLEKYIQKVDQLKVGMPWDAKVAITPLPEDGKTEYLTSLLVDAVDKGARIMNKEGGMVHETLFFPAVVYPVNSQMRLYHEEQFGPIVPVFEYNDINEPMDYLRNSRFGQQVSIFGNDPVLMTKLIDPVINQTARVNINSLCQRGPDKLPFTGRKDSAKETLSVIDALEVFSMKSVVAIKSSDHEQFFAKMIQTDLSNFLSKE